MTIEVRVPTLGESVTEATVANWFKEYADALPEELPGPDGPVEVAEQDELFTFIGHKKTKPTS